MCVDISELMNAFPLMYHVANSNSSTVMFARKRLDADGS